MKSLSSHSGNSKMNAVKCSRHPRLTVWPLDIRVLEILLISRPYYTAGIDILVFVVNSPVLTDTIGGILLSGQERIEIHLYFIKSLTNFL